MRKMLYAAVLGVLLGLSSVVSGQDDPSIEAASDVVLDIINGRGRWEGIQSLFPEQIYTYQNLSGDVEAAAAGASVRGFIQPKVILLERMRDCMQAASSARRNVRTEREDRECEARQARQDTPVIDENATFTYEGYYGGEGAWKRDKDDDDLQSECLLPLWAENFEDDSTLVLQHYGGSSGYIRGMFAEPTPIDFPSEDHIDARTMPFFVSTTTLQKDVVLLVDTTDFDEDWFENTKEGVRAVIEGLYDRDYFQIVVQSGEKTSVRECGVDGLLRATESNKEVVLEWFEALSLKDLEKSNTPDGNLTALVAKGFDLIKAAIDSPNNADSGCEPVFLLLSTQQPSGATVSYLNGENEEYGVRLFTYGLASATDPEGYLGGGAMYDLACSNDGTYYNVEEAEGLPNDMIQYLIVLIYTRTSLAPVWFVRHASHGPFDGLLVVGSLPVFSPDSDQLLGVVSVEFNFADIENFLSSLARGFSFAFLTTSEGNLLVHPSYRDPSVVKNLPLYYDVSLIENSDNFKNIIRRPLVTELSGFEKVVVDRPLPKGDIGTEGITSVPILTTFFWSRLTDLPLIVALAFSDADLRSPFYTANANAGWISSGRVAPIFNDPDAGDYFPADFFENLQENSAGQLLSYKYSAILDNFRSFLPVLQNAALSQVDSNDEYLPTSDLLQPTTIKSIMSFINNLGTPFNRNPGLMIQVKELSRIGTLFNNLWRRDYLEFCVRNCTDDPTTARFMGFYTQSLITFPGFIDHPLGQTPCFQARFRPWYQRAEANPDVATVAAPYLDAFFGGKVITVSQAVFGDPSLSQEEREIVGVVAVDYPYQRFHTDFVSETGCAYDRSFVSSVVPMCYIMDNSALLILSPDFLTPDFNTFALTSSNTLPIGLAEPELGDQLVEMKLLVVTTFINFRGSYSEVVTDDDGEPIGTTSTPIDTPQSLPLYSIDTDLLMEQYNGTVSGTLTKTNGYCSSGEWTMSLMTGTNLFLIYINDYSQDDEGPDGDACREFDLETIQNVSFSTCEQNAQLYPFSTDICPNSDQREFVVEMLRPEEAKCDRTPPKETEFVAWSDPVAIAMVTVASFLIVFTLVIWGLVFKYRSTAVILMASPTFIYMQFVGFLLGYCNVFLWTGEPTDVQCALRPWLASISFVLVVGPMFAKTYRVWRLFSPQFFDKGISDVRVLMYVGIMMIFPIIVCIVWTAYERPQPTIKDDNFDDEKTVFRCDSEGISCRVFEGILLGYGGLLVAMGSFFAFRSRRARSYFNEARFIGFSVYSIASCGVVGVTLSYVLLGLPVGYYVVFCVAVMLGIFATTMIVYFPKLKICIFKPERNRINKTNAEKDDSVVSEIRLDTEDSD